MIETHKFFYAPTDGPMRNGESRPKGMILPSPDINRVTWWQFLDMAALLVRWGQERYRNDHGSTADHQRLVDFVNVAVARAYQSEWGNRGT